MLCVMSCCLFIFFFKQKTAYEMRISDWSSDVCSSDLIEEEDIVWVQDYHFLPLGERLRAQGVRNRIGLFLHIPWPPTRLLVSLPHHERLVAAMLQIGRASCRERVCQYV